MAVPPQTGFVVGLAAEAAIIGRRAKVAIGGGMPDGAAAAARRLVMEGATALVSFGLAGGLDPALRPGAIIRPRLVRHQGRDFPTDPALTAALGGANADRLLAGDSIIATAADKRAAFARTGAVAVDLESGAVAVVAEQAGLPFAVLRAVCDPAGRNLPLAALVALDAAGRIRIGAVLRAVLARPWQIPALIGLAGDSAGARRALLLAAHQCLDSPGTPFPTMERHP